MKSHARHAPDQVALDGPSASGKSTIGSMLADRLECIFLDTGMMYRAVTNLALSREVPLDNPIALGRLASETRFSVNKGEDGSWRLLADSEDITDELYSDEINHHVSSVSAVSAVRRALVRQQRGIASERPIVMAGRDIGTVVLPDAPIKVFLTASAETRAERRTKDASGNAAGQLYEEVLHSIQRRDEIDSNRADSPLRPADDAIIVATDHLTTHEVLDKVLALIGAALPSRCRPPMVAEQVA